MRALPLDLSCLLPDDQPLPPGGGDAGGQSVRAANPLIPWRLIIATRNRLIHGYLGIDDDTIWSILQDDLPELLSALREFRARLARQSHER
ncbi:DUF86 domain-containing protein [Thiorhodococcus minor]|uniref:DUF86 domain-containing protein n=1 Tax=Thiorhodococcus minor TaxID=57489 RepID=A0A6M0K5B5_9GAMM|nr:DUF86 domain-containing protein [Thiorhodococcus minor]